MRDLTLDEELIVLRIRELKCVLSQALRDTIDILQSLELIDNIQHLGVAYHFQIEINEALTAIHDVGIEHTNDLHTIALGFRLLREQRLPISADVFNSFIDKEGEFKVSLIENVKALLSLYEAAYLGTPNEKILEKAVDFAMRHLNLMCSQLEPNMGTMVARALRTPRFRRMERLEAREFISLYEKIENRREDLLQFAKLDFLWVQSIHLEELRSISIFVDKEREFKASLIANVKALLNLYKAAENLMRRYWKKPLISQASMFNVFPIGAKYGNYGCKSFENTKV
ncbi:hypothetical protein HPP92_023499 [Vanilla planifolia]|uniref:Terpene synthase N-terminal domain-containing protein n=1 Tax=Vanilla planifolia TaxID=51239 RepID=A0A835UDU1_VANPL|nr:hypothetical protein HPP92_023499 [Vanilla planifolia]